MTRLSTCLLPRLQLVVCSRFASCVRAAIADLSRPFCRLGRAQRLCSARSAGRKPRRGRERRRQKAEEEEEEATSSGRKQKSRGAARIYFNDRFRGFEMRTDDFHFLFFHL